MRFRPRNMPAFGLLQILPAGLVLLIVGCAGHPPGHSLETGRLEAVPGFTGDQLGAEGERVSTTDNGQTQVIDLRLPIAEETVDRVEVVTPSGEPIEQRRAAEIVTDRDPRDTGIRLYLPGRKNWAFRLRLIDVPDE